MIKIECINSTFLKLSLKISSILVWLDEEIENNDKECEWSEKIFNLVPVEGQNNILLFWVAGYSIYNSKYSSVFFHVHSASSLDFFSKETSVFSENQAK